MTLILIIVLIALILSGVGPASRYNNWIGVVVVILAIWLVMRLLA
jgi:hypothetical protein